jgi:hypothetical protein
MEEFQPGTTQRSKPFAPPLQKSRCFIGVPK